MANVKLKSIFTKEDVYTVLQLLKALADGVDTNDADLQAQIDELKKKIDTLNPEPEGYSVDGSGNVTINDVLHVSKDGKAEVGKDLEVDGNIIKGYVGLYHLPVNGTPRDVVVFEGYDDYGGVPVFFTFYYHAGNGLMYAFLTNESGDNIRSADEIPSSKVKLTDGNTIALLSDVPSISGLLGTFSTARYQHTITIIGSRPVSGGGACVITLTAYSSKNTPVDSYQDLHSVFGGCALSVTGFYSPSSGTNQGAVKLDLHGGTIAKDMLYYSDPSLTTLQSVALSSCGTLTFADDVCTPK